MFNGYIVVRVPWSLFKLFSLIPDAFDDLVEAVEGNGLPDGRCLFQMDRIDMMTDVTEAWLKERMIKMIRFDENSREEH